jgi:hypothetical protein
MTRVRKAHLLSTVRAGDGDGGGIQTTGSHSSSRPRGGRGVGGHRISRRATLAVLLAAAAIVLSDAPPMPAALAGLSAACYLVLRHTEGGPASVIGASAPALVAALGFTFVGVLAASFPFELPWLPLLAPLAVFGIYVLATRPFYKAADGELELSSRS